MLWTLFPASAVEKTTPSSVWRQDLLPARANLSAFIDVLFVFSFFLYAEYADSALPPPPGSAAAVSFGRCSGRFPMRKMGKRKNEGKEREEKGKAFLAFLSVLFFLRERSGFPLRRQRDSPKCTSPPGERGDARDLRGDNWSRKGMQWKVRRN